MYVDRGRLSATRCPRVEVTEIDGEQYWSLISLVAAGLEATLDLDPLQTGFESRVNDGLKNFHPVIAGSDNFVIARGVRDDRRVPLPT